MYRVIGIFIISVFFLGCTEATTSVPREEASSEKFESLNLGSIHNGTGEMISFRYKEDGQTIVENIEAGKKFFIKAYEIDIVTYNEKPLEVNFQDNVVKSFHWYFGKQLNNKNVNITKIIFVEDSHHSKSKNSNGKVLEHIDGNTGHPDW